MDLVRIATLVRRTLGMQRGSVAHLRMVLKTNHLAGMVRRRVQRLLPNLLVAGPSVQQSLLLFNLLVAVGMAWWPSCGFGPSASVRAPAAHRSLSSIAAKQADHPITCISVSHLPACPTSQRMSRSCSTCLPFILACLPCPFRHRTSASKPRAAACSTAAS